MKRQRAKIVTDIATHVFDKLTVIINDGAELLDTEEERSMYFNRLASTTIVLAVMAAARRYTEETGRQPPPFQVVYDYLIKYFNKVIPSAMKKTEDHYETPAP